MDSTLLLNNLSQLRQRRWDNVLVSNLPKEETDPINLFFAQIISPKQRYLDFWVLIN